VTVFSYTRNSIFKYNGLALPRVSSLKEQQELYLGRTPDPIAWLKDTGERQKTACGREIEIWDFGHQEDESFLSAWASYFHQHHISDNDLSVMVDGAGMRHSEHLRAIKFHGKSLTPGPSLRSGDFVGYRSPTIWSLYSATDLHVHCVTQSGGIETIPPRAVILLASN
jgi:hypothetical protein